MTPQERQLLSELFDRLVSLENSPRDPDAVQAINEGLRRAPNALYPLVQTALVQDEALKRADARIRELEDELGIEQPQPGAFLDSMRENLSSRRDSQGSVPTVRPGAPASSPWSHQSGAASASPSGPWRTTSVPQASGYPQQGGYDASPAGGYGGPQAGGAPGGSFLGTAAAAAAGAIGGSLLMNSFRGMFGGQHGSGQAFGSGSSGTPWAPSGSGGSGDLARDAGVNDIGSSRAADAGNADSSQRASLFDTAQNDSNADFDDGDFSDGDFGDGGSDTA